MIRIERHEEVRPGIWRYTVPGFGTEGRSRQPLLDACRQVRAILGDTSQRGRAIPRGTDRGRHQPFDAVNSDRNSLLVWLNIPGASHGCARIVPFSG